MYREAKSLHQILGDQAVANAKEIEADHGELLDRLSTELDAQFDLLRFTVWTLRDGEPGARGETEPALFSALHKNAFVFFSSIDLVRRGFYGPACTLLRPIFEALVIAKYCSVMSEVKVFNRWRTGKYVHLVSDVLDHINQPLTETRALWKGLHSLVHATRYAQQVEHEYAKVKKEVRATLEIIQVLMYWNHHLLTRHFLTTSCIYYTRTYGDRSAFESARAHERALALQARNNFAGTGSLLVREYCAKWVAKAKGDITAACGGPAQKQKRPAPAAEAGR